MRCRPRPLHSLALTPLVLLTVGLVGCGGEGDAEGPETPTVEVHEANDRVEYTVRDGQGSAHVVASAEGVELPEDWPEAVPIIEGATIVTAAKANASRVLSLRLADQTADEALGYYRDALSERGWETKADTKLPGGGTFSATREDRQVTIVVGADDEETRIQIVLNDA